MPAMREQFKACAAIFKEKKSMVCPTIGNNALFYGIIVLHNRAQYHKNY